MDNELYINATALRTITLECSPEVRFIRRGEASILQQKWLEHSQGGDFHGLSVVWLDVPTVDEPTR